MDEYAPKYRVIESVLRKRISSGEYAPGEKLPSQDDLATEFGVTLMTLRHAIQGLEAAGLVWAARGKGTFVADKPVDIRYDHLSSFTSQVTAAGSQVHTEVLSVEAGGPHASPAASAALQTEDRLVLLMRRRSVNDKPISLQRSFLSRGDVSLDDLTDLGEGSLYKMLEDRLGWSLSEATETIGAVNLEAEDADRLELAEGHAAFLSRRVSFNQVGQPYLYDEVLFAGGRSVIVAERSSQRLSLSYNLVDQPEPR